MHFQINSVKVKTTNLFVLNNANGVGEIKDVSQGEEAYQRKDVNQKKKVKEKEKPIMAIVMANKSKMTKGRIKLQQSISQQIFNYFKLLNLKHLYYL